MYTRTANWHVNTFYDLYCIHDTVCNFTFVGCLKEVTHCFVLPYLEIEPGSYCDSGCRVDSAATPIPVWRLHSAIFPLAKDISSRVEQELDESPAITRLRSIKYCIPRRQYLRSVLENRKVTHCGLSTLIEALALADCYGVTLTLQPNTLERAINTHILTHCDLFTRHHDVELVFNLKGGY